MLVVGLAGGIASGKSTISAELERLGAKVIDADEISRALTSSEKGGAVLLQIRAEFGSSVFDGGRLDRRALGAIVFADDAARRRLEAIVHPAVTREIERELELCRNGVEYENNLIIISAPLFVEAGLVRLIDRLWVAYAPEDTRAHRVVLRDGLTLAQAYQRVRAQIPFGELARVADAIIPTTRPVEQTLACVARLYSSYVTKSDNGND